ncbi:unnamed protein product, partial [marine sediment metagenome]
IALLVLVSPAGAGAADTIFPGKHWDQATPESQGVDPAKLAAAVNYLKSNTPRDVISKKATVVFIYIGINDVWHSLSGRGTGKAKFEAGLRDIIARLTKSGAAVVLATPSVIGEKPTGTNRLDKMLDEYAAISRKVAADTGAHLCDLRKAFIDYLKTKNPDKSHKGVLTGDGVHLNGAGNRFVADRAAEAIAAALRKRK